jgi:hypothetical protein
VVLGNDHDRSAVVVQDAPDGGVSPVLVGRDELGAVRVAEGVVGCVGGEEAVEGCILRVLIGSSPKH